MTVYNWLSLFGIPAILSGVTGYLVAQVRVQKIKQKSIELGLQALLRDRLIQCYRYHSEKGYADVDDRSNFENLWNQYHNLGANGVMDDIHNKFLELPTQE